MKRLVFATMLVWVIGCCQGASFYDHSQLRQQITDFTAKQFSPENHYRIAISSIDSRLKLVECSRPLSFSHRNGQGSRRVVSVACEGEHPWKIYVPVTISKMQTIAVASHPLSRGHTLLEDDIIFTEKDLLRQHHGVFTQSTGLVGQIIRRPIREGDIFTPVMLQAADLVKRGQEVLILAEKGTLRVQMHGIALKGGSKGELIKVKNKKSKRTIEAIITEPGQVKVIL